MFSPHFKTVLFLLFLICASLFLFGCSTISSPYKLRDVQKTCEDSNVKLYEFSTSKIDFRLECKV